MTDKQEQKPARTVLWTVLGLAIPIVVGFMLLAPWLTQSREKARRIHCASNLKGLALALRMYCGSCNEHFPDDLSALIEVGYHTSFQCYTCPSMTTVPASALEEFRSGRHCDYLYFGKGLTEDCRGCDPGKVVILCDKPGNHRRFFNVIFTTGYWKAHVGSSIEEIADKNGLFLPGYNMPEKTEADPAPKQKPE